MGSIQKAMATIRVGGDDLSPEEITALLGANPTTAQYKGQEFPSKFASRVRKARSGMWSLEAIASEPEDFNGQVVELLDRLTGDLNIWRSISERFEIDIFCGWFMETSNDGVIISPETLRALSDRGITLMLDIYAPGK